MNFTVSRFTSKEVDVQVSFEGSVADGYQRGEMSTTPERVSVSGPEEVVELVDHARITISQEELTETYSQQCAYTLVDADGNPVTDSNLTVSPEKVLVTLPVEVLKEVPLTVNLIDGGGATSENATVTFNGTPVQNGGTITITADMTEFTIIADGAVPSNPSAGDSGTGGDDGMGLTDYLLIVLIVLIVVMAIMVAIRLMRS